MKSIPPTEPASKSPPPCGTTPAAHGDLPAPEFRAAAHRVADIMADYLENVGDYSVLPGIEPGFVRSRIPREPPCESAPMNAILDDYQKLIEPNVTHWNHPGFLAYFGITGSGPGILAEALAAALNVNAMLWKTAPAATELEELTCDWLRQMMGLPQEFRGHINDTASMSTLLALATARHELPGLEIREKGMAGRSDLPTLVVYTSDQAHSSVDKACIALGIGHGNVRHIQSDDAFQMEAKALQEAIRADRGSGKIPVSVVATAGTTSTTSVDPLREIGEICRKEGIWFHVDAAYGGSAAVCPELRPLLNGMELADSLVVNPHKWLFTPIDCSVLFVKNPDALKRAFSLVPAYLETSETHVTNLMDLGVQLGRRFRALKLWMVIRSFGVKGIQKRILAHCEMARELAGWIEEKPGFELSAPVPFSTVCFRAVPKLDPEDQNRYNQLLLDKVNARGPVFLSPTRLRGQTVLRAAIGNLRTTPGHVKQAWDIIVHANQELGATSGAGKKSDLDAQPEAPKEEAPDRGSGNPFDDFGEPVEIPIDGCLDLHTFQPREVKELVPDYLEACCEKGILDVRIVHGKGTGTLRGIVHSILKRHPMVASYRLADELRGSWGATEVRLKTAEGTSR